MNSKPLTRCRGKRGEIICPRSNKCTRYLAIGESADASDIVDYLCYSGFSFFDAVPVDVCPNCKQIVETYLEHLGNRSVEVHRCDRHGNVVPMRSAVVNRF